MVYVLDIDGKPLMPTERHGKVRRLLKERKARVVKKTPFTIQLLYNSTRYTQPVTLGVDALVQNTLVLVLQPRQKNFLPGMSSAEQIFLNCSPPEEKPAKQEETARQDTEHLDLKTGPDLHKTRFILNKKMLSLSKKDGLLPLLNIKSTRILTGLRQFRKFFP